MITEAAPRDLQSRGLMQGFAIQWFEITNLEQHQIQTGFKTLKVDKDFSSF